MNQSTRLPQDSDHNFQNYELLSMVKVSNNDDLEHAMKEPAMRPTPPPQPVLEINSAPLSIEGKHLPIEEQLMKFTKAILDKNYNEGCYDAQLSPNPMSQSIVTWNIAIT